MERLRGEASHLGLYMIAAGIISTLALAVQRIIPFGMANPGMELRFLMAATTNIGLITGGYVLVRLATAHTSPAPRKSE